MDKIISFLKKPLVLTIIIVLSLSLIATGIYYFFFFNKGSKELTNFTYKIDSKYDFKLEEFATDINQITRIKITPDGKLMLVATLKGEILVFKKDDMGMFVKQTTPLYTVDTKLEGFPRENGLTGLAFSSDYPTSKEIFLTYTTLNSSNVLKNTVARLTIDDTASQIVGKNLTVIFEGNVEPSQAHQIQNGIGVSIEGKSHFLFTIGDAFNSTNAHDLAKDAGKIMLIQRDGSNPLGTRPYPSNPKIQAIGIRNAYDITINPYDDSNKFLMSETGNVNNDKLIYGKLLSLDGKNDKQIDLKWDGTDSSQALAIPDLYTTNNPNMNMHQWAPAVTPLDVQFIKGGVGNIEESTKEHSYFLITLFGQTGSKNNTPGKEIALGKITNLDSQPTVELLPFISRSSKGDGVQGNPIGLAVDPVTQDIYFGDLFEGKIYKVSAGQNNTNTIVNTDTKNIDGVTDMTSVLTIDINIQNFEYTPKTIRVKKGTTVTWTNKDIIGHTVTSDTGSELNSEYLKKDDTFKHTFNTVGTFNYYCVPHPFMKGSIEVVE